jgi:hypothetical protein
MVISDAILLRILFFAGITNILFILMTFFSCRCMAGKKITEKLFRHFWYKKFYSNHCYYWWLFYISVIIHTSIAFYLFGNF